MATASEVVMFGLSIPSFLATGIVGLATLFISAVAYLTWRFITLLIQSYRLRRQLAAMTFEETVSQETIEGLDAAFASARGYDERWRQLRRSLAVAQPETGGTILVSSVPVRQVFNPPEILGEWFNMRLIDTVPTLLSSLGLLLTFLAILSGLNGAIGSGNSSSTTETLIEFEKMRLGIVHLVSNLSGKFLASVCALGASFLFVLYERIVVIWSISAISSIPRALDQIIQYQTSDRILREIHQAVVESVNRSRIVSAHIPQYIRQEVHHAAGATLERMEGALQQLCSIAAGMKNREGVGLPAALGELPVGIFAEFQGISAHLKTMSAALGDASQSFHLISSTLSDSTGQMVSASKALEDSLRQHAVYSKEQLEVIQNSLEVVGGRMQDAIAGTARTFTRGLEEAASKIKDSVDAAAVGFAAIAEKGADSGEGIAQVREVLEPLVARATSMVGEVNKAAIGISKASTAMQATAGAVERETAKLGEFAQSAEKAIADRDNGNRQLQEILERTVQNLDGLSTLAPSLEQSVAAAIAQAAQFSEQRHVQLFGALEREFVESSRVQQAVLRECFDQSADSLDAVKTAVTEAISRARDESSEWQERLQGYLAAADETRTQTIERLEHLGRRFEGVLGSEVKTIVTAVQESSSQLLEAVSRMSVPEAEGESMSHADGIELPVFAGVERLRDALESSAELIERGSSALDKVVQVAGEVCARGDAASEQSRALFEKHGQLLEQHRLVFESFDRGIAGLLEKLDAQLMSYNAKALEELRQQYVAGASEQLAAVHHAVEETTQSLEKIPALLVESSDRVISASRDFEEMLQQRASLAGTDLSRAVGALELVAQRLGSVVESVSERLSASVDESTGRFEAVVTHAASTLSEITKREREVAEVVSDAKAALERTVSEIVSSLSGLGGSLAAFDGLKRAIEESASAVGNGTAALSGVVAAARQLQAREEGLSAQTRELFEHNSRSLSSYQEVFQTLDQSIAKIMAQLEEQIWRFQSRVQEQLQWSLQHYDELSARGLVAFESAITNLSDVLTDHRTSSNGSRGENR